MWTLIKGEKRRLAMEVSRRSGGAFDIDTATFDTGVETGNCDIDHADQVVSFIADTTLADYKVGKRHRAEVTVTIVGQPKIIKHRTDIYIQ